MIISDRYFYLSQRHIHKFCDLTIYTDRYRYVVGLSLFKSPEACSPQKAVIEVKVPSVTFRDRKSQEDFVAAVTDIVDEFKAGTHPRSRTFVNVVYAVDGPWGIAGRAYSNEDLGAAIAASAGR